MYQDMDKKYNIVKDILDQIKVKETRKTNNVFQIMVE